MLELEVISRIESRQSLWFPCQETLGTGALSLQNRENLPEKEIFDLEDQHYTFLLDWYFRDGCLDLQPIESPQALTDELARGHFHATFHY